jgi:hypothetical protein
MEELLKDFDRALADAQVIFLEENSLLKAGKVNEHAALMDKKGHLLKDLDSIVTQLQQLRGQKTPGYKETIRNLQDKIMKLLMLDKENSQLLLKQSNFSQSPKVSLDSLEVIHKKL